MNLDSWTPEQVAYMQLLGNSVARGVYEANIPEVFRRPQTDSALEAFIRAKYEQKRYIMKDWQPPRIDPNNLPVIDDPRHRKPVESKNSATVPPPPAAVKQQISPPLVKTSSSGIEDLMASDSVKMPSQKVSPLQSSHQSSNVDDLLGLGDFVSAPLPPAVSVAPAAAMAQNSSANNDLLGLSIGSSGGGLLAAHTTVNSQSSPNLLPLGTSDGFSAPPQAQHPQDDISLMATNTGSGPNEKRSNSDILALFGTATAATPSGGTVMPGFYGAAAAAPPYNPYSMYPAQGANVYGANPMVMTGQYAPAGGFYQQPVMGVAYPPQQQPYSQPMMPPQPQQAQFAGFPQSAEQYQQMQSQFAGLQLQGGGAVMTGAPSAQAPVSTMSMNLWQ